MMRRDQAGKKNKWDEILKGDRKLGIGSADSQNRS